MNRTVEVRLAKLEAMSAPRQARYHRVPVYTEPEQQAWIADALRSGKASAADTFICRVMVG